MATLRNPHVDSDDPLVGPPGSAPGHIHQVDDAAGVRFQCPVCDTVTDHGWTELEDVQLKHFADYPEAATIKLPPCPACGALAFLSVSDVEYGVELPHHYTARAVREMIVQRPRLRGKHRVDRHDPKQRFQGLDFSHLPAKDRPPQHRPVPPPDQ
jgi:hypothetical protein